MVKQFSLGLLVWVWMSCGFAHVKLFAWRPSENHVMMILPQLESESQSEAIAAYLQHLQTEPDLQKVIPQDFARSSVAHTQEVTADKNNVIFLANQSGDMSTEPKRAKNFMTKFTTPYSEAFLLPIGAAARLDIESNQQFLQSLQEKFVGLVAMGGDDIHPELYNESITYAYEKNLNKRRDQLELQVLQFWLKAKDRFLFAVCRGHQLTAVAAGYKLIQDIKIETNSHIEHGPHTQHSIKVLKAGWKLFGSQLRRYAVNSIHHQSVIDNGSEVLQVTAVGAEDGIVEGLTGKKGLIQTLQSHPELQNDFIGRKFIQKIVGLMNAVGFRNKTCRALF